MPSSSQPSRERRGPTVATLGWALVWLAGIGAITGFSVTRHAPALERLMLEGVQDAIAPLVDAPIVVSVRDHEATLSGTVADAAERDALLAAATDSLGIRRVVDRLELRASDERSAEEPSPVEAAPVGGSALAELPAEARSTDEPSIEEPLFEEPPLAERPSVESPSEELSSEGLPAAAAEPSLAESPPEEASLEAPPSADEPLADGSRFEEPVAVSSADPSEEASPTLRLGITDRVLTIEGSLSDDDDAAALVGAAKDSFELDYVSTTIDSDTSVSPANWLEPLVALLPELAELDEPGIDVTQRQVTLRGTAPDETTRDAVVGAALERLGDYSLVEHLDVDPNANADVTDADPGDAAGADPDTTDANPDSAVTSSDMADKDSETADAELDTADADPDVTGANPDAVEADADAADANPDTIDSSSGTEQADALETSTADAPPETALLAPVEEPSAEAVDAAAADPTTPDAALEILTDAEILFESGSDTLTARSRTTLDRIAATLQRFPHVSITIEGHTDGIGLRENNLRLSQRRANAVRDHLLARGVSRERLTAYGYGEGVPIADNATPEGRAANRRIEFIY